METESPPGASLSLSGKSTLDNASKRRPNEQEVDSRIGRAGRRRVAGGGRAAGRESMARTSTRVRPEVRPKAEPDRCAEAAASRAEQAVPSGQQGVLRTGPRDDERGPRGKAGGRHRQARRAEADHSVAARAAQAAPRSAGTKDPRTADSRAAGAVPGPQGRARPTSSKAVGHGCAVPNPTPGEAHPRLPCCALALLLKYERIPEPPAGRPRPAEYISKGEISKNIRELGGGAVDPIDVVVRSRVTARRRK